MRSVSIGVLILTLLVGSAAIFAFNGASIDLSFLKAATSTAFKSDKTAPADDAAKTETLDASVKAAATELAAVSDSIGDRANAQSTDGEAPAFDVVRIDPDGTSVFAGRAASSEQISIIAGDTPIGTAKADASGNWVLVTEKKIPDPNAELKIVKGVVQPEPPAAEAARLAGSDAQSAITYGGKASARDVNQRMIASLEQMIETARGKQAGATVRGDVERAEQTSGQSLTPPPDAENSAAPLTAAANSSGASASHTAPEQGQSPTAQSAARLAEASASAQQGRWPASASSVESPAPGGTAQTIPIPIQFVYREATFTEQGRKAASLLLEYLLVANPREVTLTGHADERGSPDLNMTLSEERLQAVRDYVRAGGYTGELTMTPKGETEPYRGIDRSKYPREELYTLDRRVELRLDG